MKTRLAAGFGAERAAQISADPTALTLSGMDCPDFLWPMFVVTERMPQEGIDAVFGPALDGGYYMLALGKPCPELFSGIPWSTERTPEASLAAAGRKVHVMEQRLWDH